MYINVNFNKHGDKNILFGESEWAGQVRKQLFVIY